MKKALIFAFLGLILYRTPLLKKKDAETIGDFLGYGMQGIALDLPDNKVLKIVDLNTPENAYSAQFLNYYALATANGKLAPSKHLPNISYFNAGYANRMMVEQIDEEWPKDAWRNNVIQYGTPVAMWVMDKYDEPNVVLHPKYEGVEEDLNEAKKALNRYFDEHDLGDLMDLHEENYGFDDKGNIVFFDFDVIISNKVIEQLEKM